MEGPCAAMGTPLTERGGRSTRQALVTRQCSVLSPLYLYRRPILCRPGELTLPAIEPATENLHGERRGRFIDFFHGATPPGTAAAESALALATKASISRDPPQNLSQVSTLLVRKFPRWQSIPRGEKLERPFTYLGNLRSFRGKPSDRDASRTFEIGKVPWETSRS